MCKCYSRFDQRLQNPSFAAAFVEKQLREKITQEILSVYTTNTINFYEELATALHVAKHKVIVQVSKLITNKMSFISFQKNVNRILNDDADDLADDTSKQANDVYNALDLNFDLVAETIADMELLMFNNESIYKKLQELCGISLNCH